MDVKEVVRSQYLAVLAMFEDAIVKCPEAIWAAPEPKNRFWHVAYHALFYTHLYLQPTGADFKPWSKHREQYQFMGPVPWPPHGEPQIGEPYAKEDVLEYLTFCRDEVEKQVPALNLDAPSGFDWLPFNKLELQIYSIRHVQQHVGELSERLGAQAAIDVQWVGRG